MSISPWCSCCRDDIVEQVRSVIKRTGIVLENLTLEVTEATINDMSRMKKILSEIRALGVRVALDDFGTGYSHSIIFFFCRLMSSRLTAVLSLTLGRMNFPPPS